MAPVLIRKQQTFSRELLFMAPPKSLIKGLKQIDSVNIHLFDVKIVPLKKNGKRF